MPDEFSGKRLSKDWQLLGGDGVRASLERGKLFFFTNHGSEGFLLRTPKAGDWQIETKIEECVDRGQGYLHGLVLFADECHYLVWGKAEEGVALRLCLGGEERIILTAPDDDFVKIRKVTRGTKHATYYFYSNHIFSGVRQQRYRGCYEDREHIFDDVQYGLYAKGDGPCAAVYDYIADNILEYDLSAFPDLGTVDGIWHTEKERASVQACGGSLQAEFFADGPVPVLQRMPIGADWRILTCVHQPRYSFGLMMYRDEEHYILLTGHGAWLCSQGHGAWIGSGGKNHPWLRITKEGTNYFFETAADGMNFVVRAIFKDEKDIFQGTTYGIGGLDMKKQIAGCSFIREMAAPNGMIWDVAGYRQIGRLIGAPEDQPMNDTYTMAHLRSGDEGNLTDAGDRVYMMLGDSFSGDGTHSTDWRCNVLTTIDQDSLPEDGLKISHIISDEKGMMRELITARHQDYDEVTCIQSHGVYIDVKLYYHYISVYHWGIGAHWDCNHAGWAWSQDGGETWQRKKPFFSPESNFMYSSLYRKDGYVYIFGIPSGKFGGLKLGRAPENDILDKTAYSYFAGVDAQGTPIWVHHEEEGVLLVDDQVSEFSVAYHAGLDRYLLTYANQYTQCLVIRDAPSLWGPWSHPNILREFEMDKKFYYGPYMLDRYTRNTEKQMYFVATDAPGYYLTWNGAKLITTDERMVRD